MQIPEQKEDTLASEQDHLSLQKQNKLFCFWEVFVQNVFPNSPRSLFQNLITLLMFQKLFYM